MAEETKDGRRESGPVEEELRTRRLVVVDDQDIERAVIEVVDRHVELRLLAEDAGQRCEVMVFAGQVGPGELAAGVELWVDGDAIAGQSVVVEGGAVTIHRFDETNGEQDEHR